MATNYYKDVTIEQERQAKAWVQEMYQMADSKDVNMVARFLKDDAVLNFANNTPLKGRTAMENLFLWEYGACGRIAHSIRDVRVLHDQIFVTLMITYQFINGSQQLVRSCMVWHKSTKDKKASRVDIYGDFTNVMQQLSAVAGSPPC